MVGGKVDQNTAHRPCQAEDQSNNLSLFNQRTSGRPSNDRQKTESESETKPGSFGLLKNESEGRKRAGSKSPLPVRGLQ